MDIVQIDGWELDDRFSPYPEGSRDKYAVISPEVVEDDRIVPNHRYLVKFSNDRYPVQFWSEIIAEMLGTRMSVPVPRSLLTLDPKTKAPASLTEWFYGEAVEQYLQPTTPISATDNHQADLEPKNVPHSHSLYVPGSSYMAKYIPDYDMKKGKQHNIQTLYKFVYALRLKYKIDFWPLWAMYFTFDALIGNTDRHQDNWGVLWRRADGDVAQPRFAPAFDNGTSLLHEILEQKLVNFSDQDWRDRYIARGTHHIKETADATKQLGHLELIEILTDRYPQIVPSIKAVLEFDLEDFAEDLMNLVTLPSPVPLTEERVRAIVAVIDDRRSRMLEIVGTT